MSPESADLIYGVLQIGTILIGLAAVFYLHRNFNSPALLERPQSLSNARLRNVLAWGRFVHRFHHGTPKGRETLERMHIALEELRRRGEYD